MCIKQRIYLWCPRNNIGSYLAKARFGWFLFFEENKSKTFERFYAEQDEGVYGGGEQYSFFNIRGERFEMLTREQESADYRS